jgi:metal-sulfur cluster biosynthetic enzyme
MEKITLEVIEQTIKNVEHPEIANTLGELGMIRDVTFEEETGVVKFTLVLPMMGIPVQIRDMILNSISTALKGKAKKLGVNLAEMTEEERAHFFELSQKNWKL